MQETPRPRIEHFASAPFTSATLMALHGAVYERLFGRSHCVLSAPLAFRWTGDRVSTRSVSLHQHLPRRVLIGIQRTGGEGTVLGDMEEYDTLLGGFRTANADARARYEQILLAHPIPALVGCTVHLVIEGAGGRNLGVTGAVTALLSLGVSLLEGAIAPADIAAWAREPHAETLRRPEVRAVIRRGLALLTTVRAGFGSGSSIVSALLPSADPLLITTYRDVDGPAEERLFATSYRELTGLAEPPVDVAILFSGRRNQLSPQLVPGSDDAFFADAAERLKERLPEGLELFTPFHGEPRETTGGFYDRLFLDVLFSTLQAGEQGFMGRRLLHALNRRYAFLLALDRVPPHMRDLGVALQTYFLDTEIGVAPMANTAHGGSFLLLTPRDAARDALLRIAVELPTFGFDAATIEYLSFRDGGAGGAQIEQFLEGGLVGAHLGASSVRCTRYDAGIAETTVRDRGAVDPCDVLFDGASERVLIAGAPVTSKELFSQRMTIEVFERLLAAPDFSVRSSELPRSSYSASRTEAQTKLLAPLRRAVQARTGKDLRLKIHGSITSFTIQLLPSDVTLAAIAPLRSRVRK